jgi:DNA polymerase III subunit gamma/tau
MSYTVLARRYRSSTFDDLVGQDHIARTLKRAIESDRIAHAYLFCGTRGTGKTSTARILAKALNCEKYDKPTPTPCGKCNSCLAIARGDDIDVIEIDAASNTGVDNVRDLIANSQYRPARARFKVYIIDEVHMLSKSAFNALLKTLEEPPSHVKFILATTEPEKVLPTILSRCQRYDFRNISSREIAGHLKEICKNEKIKADDDALLLVAKAGAGSMRDSLSLLDRLLSVGEKHITVELIEQLLGLPKTQLIFELAETIAKGKPGETLTKADTMIQAGLSPESLLTALIDHLRNLLILATCGKDSQLVEVPGLSLDEMVKQSQCFDPAALTQDISILEELKRMLRTSQTGRALLDATLVRLAMSDQFTRIAELIAHTDEVPTSSAASPVQKKKFELTGNLPQNGRLSAIRGTCVSPVVPSRTGETPVPRAGQGDSVSEWTVADATPSTSAEEDDDLPRPGKVWDNSGPSLSELLRNQQSADGGISAAAPEPSNVEPVSTQDLAGIWKSFLSQLTAGNQNLGVSGLLASGKLVAIDDGQAVVRIANDVHVRMLDKKKDVVRETLAKVLSRPMGVRFELDTEAAQPAAATTAPARPAASQQKRAEPAPMPQAPAAPVFRPTPELMEQIQNDPLVRAVMNELGATIAKVTEE